MRSRAALIAVVLLAAIVATACGDDSGSPEGVAEIRVSVTHPESNYVVPWLAAMDQGFFEARGVTIEEIVPGKGGSTSLRNMLQGDLAFADVSYPAVVQGQEEGAAVVIVGGAQQSVYNNQFRALATNDDVNELADVKTWAYTNPGSVTEALSYLIPERAGVDPASIERIPAGGTGEGVALLEAGDVDIASVPPSVYLRDPDKYKNIVDSLEHLPAFQQTVIASTPQYVEENPEIVKAVLAGYQEGAEWAKAHPEEAGRLYAEQTQVKPEIAIQEVKEAAAAEAWSVGFNVEAIEAAGQALGVTGYAGEVPYCDLFDGSHLPEGASTELPGGSCVQS